MDIIVVGGGIIGLTVAYELRRRGHNVRVLEKKAPGWGSSEHNAGLIVASKVVPLPSPDVISHLPGYLLRRDSPLYIRPSYSLFAARWLLKFLLYSNQRDYEKGARALRDLSQYALPFFDRLLAEGTSFEMHSQGVYVVYQDVAELEKALRDIRGREDVEVINGEHLADIEPALRPGMAGALWFKNDRHVRPSTVVQGIAKRLTEIGGSLDVGIEVRSFRQERGRVTHVETGSGSLEADVVILAAGAWTPRLARQLRSYALPIESGKGYSITISRPPVSLRVPVYLGQSKVICTPFADGSLRLAGTMEFSGLNKEVDRRRLESLTRVTASYLRNWPANLPVDGQSWDYWVGARPVTPDGLPIIGPMPGYENVYIAAGHANYGLTLAPGTAVVLADLIERGETDIDVTPFQPVRFVKAA